VRIPVTLAPLLLCAACASSPEASWKAAGAVSVPLAGTWPPVVNAVVEGPGAKAGARLMIDTGAEDAALDEKLAEFLELGRTWRLAQVQGFDPAQGGVGHHTMFKREVKALSLEGVCRLEDLDVLPLPMPKTRDGAIGLAAFPGRAVVLDPERKSVTFVPASEVEALVRRDGACSLAARRDGNLLVVRASLETRAGTFERDMIVDTGSSESFLTEDALADMQLCPVGDEVVAGVKLGSVEVGKKVLRIERGGSYCTLGGAVLLQLGRPVLFDLEGARVVLLPPGSN
jgi:hypothetical protein